MSKPQNQDGKLDADQPAVDIPPATGEDTTGESANQDETIGIGQATAAATDEADTAYKVGRGRPPLEYQWPKGQSGNPAGRPRKQLDQKATFERIMNEPVVIRSPDGKERTVPKYDALIRSHVAKAIKGDVRAASFVLTEGERLGFGQEQNGGMSGLPASTLQAVQSDLVFSNLDLDLLSQDDKIELARLGKIIDLGGDLTALSVGDFARMKQITDKGRGKDVTPRA